VAPTRNDYKLGAGVKAGAPTRTIGTDYISWAASFTLDTAADIAEAGMRIMLQLWSGTAVGFERFMLFRDTFTPVSVPAGGTISVTYTLKL